MFIFPSCKDVIFYNLFFPLSDKESIFLECMSFFFTNILIGLDFIFLKLNWITSAIILLLRLLKKYCWRNSKKPCIIIKFDDEEFNEDAWFSVNKISLCSFFFRIKYRNFGMMKLQLKKSFLCVNCSWWNHSEQIDLFKPVTGNYSYFKDKLPYFLI